MPGVARIATGAAVALLTVAALEPWGPGDGGPARLGYRPTPVPNAWLDDLHFALRPIAPTGVVTVQVSLAGAAGLADVRLQPQWAAVSAAASRRHGWLRLRRAEPEVRVGREPVAVASGSVPAGEYRRVMVAVPRVVAASGGRQVEITSHIEPIARSFRLDPGAGATLHLVLVVLARSPRTGGGYEMFVQDAFDQS